jgi:hypothetical protein
MEIAQVKSADPLRYKLAKREREKVMDRALEDGPIQRIKYKEKYRYFFSLY